MNQAFETALKQAQLECNRAALFALKDKPNGQHYGPKQWVPDEYENLERMGLVACEFGLSSPLSPFLRERTITLTQNGKFMLGLLPPVEGLEQLRVRHSFKSALQERYPKAQEANNAAA